MVIVRRGEGSFSERLPDGLDPLADHNLISYKSLHEPLDDWTLKELTGHYVNYRKRVSGPSGELLPETSFRLLGVSTRFPQRLVFVATPAERNMMCKSRHPISQSLCEPAANTLSC